MRIKPGGRTRLALFAACLLFIAAVGGAWYHRSQSRTVGYSVRMIAEAADSHDLEKFKKYVDIDRIADSASDVILERITEAGFSQPGGSFATFAKIFKPPLASGLKKAAEDFVKTGQWGTRAEAGGDGVNTRRLLEKIGLGDLEPGSAEVTGSSGDSAVAGLRVYQRASGTDFSLKVTMEPDEDGVWRATGIENLGDFLDAVGSARREALRKYLAETDSMIEKTSDVTGAAEKAMTAIVKGSGLGDTSTRKKMRDIVTSELIPAWTSLGDSLGSLDAPPEARSLHHLRRRIAKMRVDYSRTYAEWLDTKDVDAVRKSNELLKEVRTLEREADVLTRQLRQKER